MGIRFRYGLENRIEISATSLTRGCFSFQTLMSISFSPLYLIIRTITHKKCFSIRMRVWEASRTIETFVSIRDRISYFFIGQSNRMFLESENIKSLWKEWNSLPAFNFEQCWRNKSLSKFSNINDLFSDSFCINIDSIESYLKGSDEIKVLQNIFEMFYRT